LIKNIDSDEQIRLLNSVKKQLELIGKYCPSLASRILFINVLKLLKELIEKLKKEMKKQEFKSNKYWRIIGGSGHLCDRCKRWCAHGQTIEHRKTKTRLCEYCYITQ